MLDVYSIFIKNNCRIPIAKHIKSWLGKNGIMVMEWLAYTFNLTPIRNLWFLLKNFICKTTPDVLTISGTK